jgi:hydrogenase maturation factor
MMEGPQPVVGRVVALEPGGCGRVSVRGARIEVALDLVPQARVGDAVLVQAGVALALVREEAATADERGE